MIAILGIDPGGTTGFALLRAYRQGESWVEPEIRDTEAVPADKAANALHYWILTWRPVSRLVVAIEEYRNYGDTSKAKIGSSNPESQQIGQIQEICRSLEIEYVMQPTSIKKPAMVYAKRLGIIHGHPVTLHERDACAHAAWLYRQFAFNRMA